MSGDAYDYMVSEADSCVLKNLATMGERLKTLKKAYEDADKAAQEAKKEYEYYASSVLPMEMFNAGVTSLELASGGTMRYERNYYCQPNKNAADRAKIIAWLRENGGGHLVKSKGTVDGAQLEKLKASGIPFSETDDINTNSLKAFLKDALGINGGTAQMAIQDIPNEVHFHEVGAVSIDV